MVRILYYQFHYFLFVSSNKSNKSMENLLQDLDNKLDRVFNELKLSNQQSHREYVNILRGYYDKLNNVLELRIMFAQVVEEGLDRGYYDIVPDGKPV